MKSIKETRGLSFLFLATEYFVGFAKCLLLEEAETGKMWENALGRYDRAMKNLVADILREIENPEEKLINALMKMRTPESTKRAAEAIQKGYI